MERLSGLDAFFVYAETPAMHLHVSLLALLEPRDAAAGYDYERLHAFLAQQALAIPQFRRRLVQVPLGVHHPVWLEDPAFDLVHHIKRVACPAPGGTTELTELVGRINSTPLDRARPLWEMWIIEGLAGGRHAVLAKVHHGIADGMTGAALLARLFALSPDATVGARPPLPPPEPIPSDWELLRDGLRERVQTTREVGALFRQTVDAFRTVVQRRHDGVHHAGATPLDAPRVYWNAPITASRSVAFARVALSDLKLVRKTFGCTLNDVVLAVCAGALRRHLERHGRLPLAPLVAGVPVAVPGGSVAAGNHVSAMFASLATNLQDPVERLRAIASATRDSKEEHAVFGGELVAHWAELSSPATAVPFFRAYSELHLSRQHRPLYNVAISNVPGPPVPLYLAGAKVVGVYPLGPIMEGMGLNITVMSYIEQVDFGFNAGSAVLPDVQDIAAEIAPALHELVERARVAASEHAP